MRIDRRLFTSPLNARKSRGPTTPEGKARSAAGNNLRHGLLAHNIVLDEESTARFATHAARFQHQLEPRDFVEHTLVESLITIRWRQLRVWNAEKVTLSEEMRNQAAGLPSIPKSVRAAFAFRSLAEKSRSLELIGRFEARFERQFTRTLNRYLQLRARETVNSLFDPNSSDLETAANNSKQDTYPTLNQPDEEPKPS